MLRRAPGLLPEAAAGEQLAVADLCPVVFAPDPEEQMTIWRLCLRPIPWPTL